MSVTTDTTALRVEHGTKRIRTYLGGELVADTTRPLLVWEKTYYPTYYFPAEDVRGELLSPAGEATVTPGVGAGRAFAVAAGGRVEGAAATRYEHSPNEELRDAVRLEWAAMDAWFEEDEQVFTHPRSPYTRIDILSSSRHIRAELEGTTIAETTKPTLLFETGLVTRYYVPKTHVRMDLLVPSDSVSDCPYKGTAEYWSVRVGAELRIDAAWSYPAPLSESDRIAGLVAFFPEQVDVYVDHALQNR